MTPFYFLVSSWALASLIIAALGVGLAVSAKRGDELFEKAALEKVDRFLFSRKPKDYFQRIANAFSEEEFQKSLFFSRLYKQNYGKEGTP